MVEFFVRGDGRGGELAVYINADFPEKRVPDATSHRSSDYDPVLVQFSFWPTGGSAGLRGLAIGALGGVVDF